MNYIGGFNYFLLTVKYQLGGGIRIFHYDQFENIQVIYSDLKKLFYIYVHFYVQDCLGNIRIYIKTLAVRIIEPILFLIFSFIE